LAWGWLGAAVIAKRPPTERHTYGWRRATLLSPPANTLLLVAFSGALLDPATALLVAVVVAVGSFGLLREAFNAAMDAVPRSIDQQQVRAWLLQQPGVSALHHLHVWLLGAGEIAMTAHLVRADDADHDALIDRISAGLDDRFCINHPTLQIERGAGCEHDCDDRAAHGTLPTAHPSDGEDHGHTHDAGDHAGHGDR